MASAVVDGYLWAAAIEFGAPSLHLGFPADPRISEGSQEIQGAGTVPGTLWPPPINGRPYGTGLLKLSGTS